MDTTFRVSTHDICVVSGHTPTHKEPFANVNKLRLTCRETMALPQKPVLLPARAGALFAHEKHFAYFCSVISDIKTNLTSICQ